MKIKVSEFRLKLYPEDFYKVRDFYEKTLGFEVINQWDRGEESRGAMFAVGTTVLELLSSKNHQPVSGVDISLEVEDVRALWEQWQGSDSVVFELRDNSWGDTSFCISDPEGFQLTFFTRH